jgi:Tol biopolymer transport system component
LWRSEAGQSVEIWKGSDGPLFEPPAISPDGLRAVIILRQNGKQSLRVIAADGSQGSPLAETINVRGAASWSPDGKWISIGGDDGTGPGLFKIPTDGSAPVRLVAGVALNPEWSPDGSLIVYSEANVAGATPVRAVRAEGGQADLPPIQVRPAGERYRFLPNGKGLIYMQGGFASQDFYLLDLATMKSRQLTHLSNPETMRTFDITPDGKQIVFDRLRENSDIQLIDLKR